MSDNETQTDAKKALSNAERQAAFKAKKEEAMQQLTNTNALLQAENTKLHSEISELKEKLHRQEVAHLKEKMKMLAQK